jgi:hypothetical protein
VEVFVFFFFAVFRVVRVACSSSPHVALVVGHGRWLWLVSALAVAFLAIDWPVGQGLEGYGAGFAAFGAFCVKVHLVHSPLFALQSLYFLRLDLQNRDNALASTYKI